MMWKMVTLLVGLSALAQINEQCVLTAGGKPVHVTADGFYDLRAVPAGAPVRLYARCTDASGVVRYGRTEFLQPEAGQLLEYLYRLIEVEAWGTEIQHGPWLLRLQD